MATKFKYVRFDRDGFLFFQDDFPCPPLVTIAFEALGMFLPRVDVKDLKTASDILVREPGIVPAVASAEAWVRDIGLKSRSLRQRELEEAVKFIEATIRKELKKNVRTSPAADFCFCAALHEEATGETIKLRLKTGRVLGRLELVAAAALINCEQCIEAYLANDAHQVALLMAGLHRCSREFYNHGVIEVRSVKTSGWARKGHKNSPMDAVRLEYDRWQSRQVQYDNDSDFAKKMILAGSPLSEGGIKNACTRWRAEQKKSSY